MKKMNDIDLDCWSLVAEGAIGDSIHWQDGYQSIERVCELLALLEEVDPSTVDLEGLLNGLDCLDEIGSMGFPPLYNIDTIEEIDGFLCDLSSADGDVPGEDHPGMSFALIKIYIEKAKENKLLDQFSTLEKRLEAYPPLQSYI